MSDPVQEYLDRLYRRLRTTPAEGRRLLREVEDHLQDAVAEEVAAGRSEADARRRAVDRLGPARQVAPVPRLALLRELAAAGGLLAGIGLVAIGLSGALAAGMNAAFGPDFVGRTPLGAVAATGDCPRLLALHPGAHSCAAAAVLENSSDAVSLRGLAGLTGVVLLAGYAVGRRRRRGVGQVLPPAAVPAAGSVLLAGAGAVLTGIAVDTAGTTGADGVGFTLSGGIAALLVAGLLLVPLCRARQSRLERAG